MLRHASFLLAILTAIAPAAHAADASAKQVLKDKSLRKLGTTYVLTAERELSDRLREVRKAQRAMNDVAKQVAALQKQDQQIEQYQRLAVAQRRRASLLLARATTVTQNNRAIALGNELSDRLLLLGDQRMVLEKQADAVRTKRSAAREKYMQGLLHLRQHIDKTREDYAGLAKAADVERALAELNRTAKRKLSLGPSRSFERNIKAFEKLEATLLTDAIPLRREANVFWLDVTINEEASKEMVLDTGASLVSVPSGLARALGLNPTDDDPTLTLILADGRTVEAKRMTLKTVRVGKFTIRNVACAVLPPTLTNAPPLLGGTFLQHFIYKVDPDAKTLTLSQVETPASKSKTPRKRRAKNKSERK